MGVVSLPAPRRGHRRSSTGNEAGNRRSTSTVTDKSRSRTRQADTGRRSPGAERRAAGAERKSSGGSARSRETDRRAKLRIPFRSRNRSRTNVVKLAAREDAGTTGQQRRSTTGVSRTIRFAVVSVVAMIAMAVAIQAQQVAGQQVLDGVRTESQAQSRVQADLRAAVAEAESPSALLDNAAEIGMIEPAAVVAVPTPGSVPAAPVGTHTGEVAAQGRS